MAGVGAPVTRAPAKFARAFLTFPPPRRFPMYLNLLPQIWRGRRRWPGRSGARVVPTPAGEGAYESRNREELRHCLGAGITGSTHARATTVSQAIRAPLKKFAPLAPCAYVQVFLEIPTSTGCSSVRYMYLGGTCTSHLDYVMDMSAESLAEFLQKAKGLRFVHPPAAVRIKEPLLFPPPGRGDPPYATLESRLIKHISPEADFIQFASQHCMGRLWSWFAPTRGDRAEADR